MKRFIVIVILALGFSLILGCGQEKGVEYHAQQYMNAVVAGDMEGMLKYSMDLQKIKSEDPEEYDEMLKKNEVAMLKRGKVKLLGLVIVEEPKIFDYCGSEMESAQFTAVFEIKDQQQELNFAMVKITHEFKEMHPEIISEEGDWALVSAQIYMDFFSGARAPNAQACIGAIYNAAKMYLKNRGKNPANVELLEESGYLDIDEATKKQWNFRIIGSNPITQIEAVSTDKMKGGAGNKIVFHVQEGRFTGYGFPKN